MPSNSAPATPAPRRAFTLPPQSSASAKSSPSQEHKVETLYAHASARVVQFTAGSPLYSKTYSSDDAATAEEEAGSLSWTSKLERTIAIGPLHVYRAPGSVAFLNCGRVVQAILPKSKCWCVEPSEGKFVLQMRKPQYWRIELKDIHPDDLQPVEALKDVFTQILLFDKTACPFGRSFSVDLPEPSPIIYKPWKAPPRPAKDVTTEPKLSIAKGKSKKVPSGDFQNSQDSHNYCPAFSEDNESGQENGDDNDTFKIQQSDVTSATNSLLLTDSEDSDSRPDVLQASRSVTAPPQLTLVTSPPSKAVAMDIRFPSTRRDSAPLPDASPPESFHSVQSWHSPVTASSRSSTELRATSPTMFPYPHDKISLPKRPAHNREISEATMKSETSTTETPGIWESNHEIAEETEGTSTPPPTPTLIDDIEDNLDEEHFEICTPPPKGQLRHRPTTGINTRRRTLSPLPPAINIFSPTHRRPRHLQTARHFPTAILQKTCEILLSPPSHLLHLMLDIAAKIGAGEWRGMVYGFGEGGEQVVGRWDYEDDELLGEGWEEDDYGIRLATRTQQQQQPRRRAKSGGEQGSWEVD